MQAITANDNDTASPRPFIEYDGVVRYPPIGLYEPGGIFYYEVVITEEGLRKFPLLAMVTLEEIDPLELSHGLDGTLTMRGFRRLVFSRDRAEFEAYCLVDEFQKTTGLELSLAATPHLRRQ